MTYLFSSRWSSTRFHWLKNECSEAAWNTQHRPLLIMTSFAEKHCWSSFFLWLFIHTLLIFKLFTPSVPMCRQFMLYILLSGKIRWEKINRFHCFSVNYGLYTYSYKKTQNIAQKGFLLGPKAPSLKMDWFFVVVVVVGSNFRDCAV